MDIDTIIDEWSGTPEELLIFILTRCTIDADGQVSLTQTSQALASFDE
jgi:hypothetical protein